MHSELIWHDFHCGLAVVWIPKISQWVAQSFVQHYRLLLLLKYLL
jgi:hypothetical protein